jgi:hypothetical protein
MIYTDGRHRPDSIREHDAQQLNLPHSGWWLRAQIAFCGGGRSLASGQEPQPAEVPAVARWFQIAPGVVLWYGQTCALVLEFSRPSYGMWLKGRDSIFAVDISRTRAAQARPNRPLAIDDVTPKASLVAAPVRSTAPVRRHQNPMSRLNRTDSGRGLLVRRCG